MTVDTPALPKEPSLAAEVVKTLIYALLIVLSVRSFLWQPYNIPSASMVDTLLVGDYVWVSKYSYGYSRYSFPFGLPLFEGRVWAAEPERGDIVVFKLPSDNATDYIKRVVGLPGDRIQMKRGVLHINGVPVGMTEIGDMTYDVPPRMGVKGKRWRETLPGGRTHDIIDTYEAAAGDNTREFVVPAGHYFMLGDNRDDSMDSRFAPEDKGVGFVPYENIVGRASAIFFSADGSASFLEIWKWPTAIRWERIFRTLE